MSSYTDTMIKLERLTQSTNAQQMQWQEKMSKTSHQMEVNDLIASGLNPVLSANQGAQSYSTSLESGANAIANTYAAKESSAATRYAARQSAAATRAAAWANLEAARLGYNASIQNNVRDNATAQLMNAANNTVQVWKIRNENANSLWAAIDKVTRNSGIQSAVLGSHQIKADVKAIQGLLGKNPGKYLANEGIKAITNFSHLNGEAKSQVKTLVNHLGLSISNRSILNLAAKATFGHNGNALRSLFLLVNKLRSSNASSLNRPNIR